MKSLFAMGAALLLAGSAVMADTAPASAGPTPAVKPAHHSAKYCEKAATEKKLSGEERTRFVKECQEGKSAK